MRGLFGIVGLLVTLAIVGLVVKKQMQTTIAVPVIAVSGVPAIATSGTVQQQTQQVQQQYKQSVDNAMQPTRPEPDAK
ncbi:MAG: hypothetical protein RIR79_977 [Pseudomonadota bacterium]